MSLAKRELERHWALEAAAVEVLVEAHAVDRCDMHDEILIDQGDDETLRRAYAIGTNRWKAGEIDGTREEFMDAIKKARDEADYQCNICADRMARD
jgi:hypothetical protein